MVEEGKPAPDFELTSDAGETVKLSDFRGKPVVLYFYPKDDTPGCTAEACSFRDHEADLTKEHAVVLGVSTDPLASHEKFTEKHHLNFPLLSDFWPHGDVARSYGVFDEASGMAVRGTFVVDPQRRLVWQLVNGPGEQRDIGVLHRAVKDL
jgi:peroxiredoxin